MTMREVSAGGVVLGAEGLLLVKVKNLESQVVWTFPKGHLEKGETPEDAALREVLEETGWKCRILSRLGDVHYRFTRELATLKKTVHWYRMEPLERTSACDPEEILDCRWYTLREAAELLVYKSDKKIMTLLKQDAAVP